MQGHQRLLQNCEYATAPTDVLVARMTALGVIAKRIPNTINFQQLELAKTLMPKKSSQINCALVILAALRAIMLTFNNVKLLY
ncbi:MAG: hypothetical protein HWD59_08490 [Coxiellaceae bacterium]|nr:MAG: hypothetical protein HWD59_08490 [Coxiellaceae bacterium]